MSLSNAIKAALLDAYFGDNGLTVPASLYVGLSSTSPTVTGGNVTEPSTGGYARVEITNTGASDWNAATSADPSVKDNSVEITFPQSTAAWLAGADLTHFVIYTAASAGDFVASAQLDTARSVDAEGITLRFNAGDLNIDLRSPA